jgi:hypothetical protein
VAHPRVELGLTRRWTPRDEFHLSGLGQRSKIAGPFQKVQTPVLGRPAPVGSEWRDAAGTRRRDAGAARAMGSHHLLRKRMGTLSSVAAGIRTRILFGAYQRRLTSAATRFKERILKVFTKIRPARGNATGKTGLQEPVPSECAGTGGGLVSSGGFMMKDESDSGKVS